MERYNNYKDKTIKEVFTFIYDTKDWQKTENIESVSGRGSTLLHTQNIRKELPEIFEKLNIRSLLDFGCGDLNWIKDLIALLDKYQGIDLVDDLISENTKKYGNKFITFLIDDITTFKFNEFYDAILVKDVFNHLKTDQILEILTNLKQSKIKYLIATNFTDIEINTNIDVFGLWRPLNLEKEPFNLTENIYSISENNEKYIFLEIEHDDKNLTVWKIN